MKRIVGLILSVFAVVSLVAVIGCNPQKGGNTAAGGDQMVGVWAMKDNPSKTVSVTKEGDQYFYTGSQPKTACQKTGDTTLACDMGSPEASMPVTLTFDFEKNELTVNFMGGDYIYTKAEAK